MTTPEWTIIPATVIGIEWNLCDKLSVTCDHCHDLYDSRMWKFTPRDITESALRDEGWLTPGDNVHICPICVNATSVKPTMEARP